MQNISQHRVYDTNDQFDLVGGPFAVVESDPGVFTRLLRGLGVRGLSVTEIYDIEPWAADHLKPLGLIFCYLCTDDSDTVGAENAYNEFYDPDAEQVWFANQLSNDSCASLALLNVVFNLPGVELGERLSSFRTDTERMSSVMKGLSITNCTLIREVHNALARPADLRSALHSLATTTVNAAKKKASREKGPPPTKRRKTNFGGRKRLKNSEAAGDNEDQYHFIGYVSAHGRVWELDSICASGPLEVGEVPTTYEPGQSWMDIVRPALRRKMQKAQREQNNHVRYNLLAIVEGKYEKLSDKLEMLKRERNHLERRLNTAYPEGWEDKNFGSLKMEKDLAILDLPERNLVLEWENCVRTALRVKSEVEDELKSSYKTNTEHINRTFDYEPFMKNFIECMHREGLLDGAISGEDPKNENNND